VSRGRARMSRRGPALTPSTGLTFTSAEGHHGRLSLAGAVVSSHLHLVEAPRVQPGEGQAMLRGWDVPHHPAVRGVGDLLRDQRRRCKAGDRLGFLPGPSSETVTTGCASTRATFLACKGGRSFQPDAAKMKDSGFGRPRHQTPRCFLDPRGSLSPVLSVGSP